MYCVQVALAPAYYSLMTSQDVKRLVRFFSVSFSQNSLERVKVVVMKIANSSRPYAKSNCDCN